MDSTRARGEQAGEPPRVDGPEIVFQWDYGVRVPLWDEEGLLPEEPAWLREAMGLSDALVEDLARWGRAMEALDGNPEGLSVEQVSLRYAALDDQARDLASRLQDEVGTRWRVRRVPW